MALGFEDVHVGVWTSERGPSGCTVILPPDGTVGAMAVRGQAPGTREAAALSPQGKVEMCHAVVLAGGSAFGLAAADGVARWLEAKGIGYPLPTGVVPIVGAAIVLDQGATDPGVRPDASAGWAACEDAAADDPPEGTVGAGAGVSVAKVGGLDDGWRSGQGVSIQRDGDLVVAALVVNNALGEIVGDDGRVLVASRAPQDGPRFPADAQALLAGIGEQQGPATNTVIGCVVTNARLSKLATHRMADLAHDGIVRAVRPAHTSFDGDALVGLSIPRVDAGLDHVTDLAVTAVADAARRGALLASTGYGMPGKADVVEAR